MIYEGRRAGYRAAGVPVYPAGWVYIAPKGLLGRDEPHLIIARPPGDHELGSPYILVRSRQIGLDDPDGRPVADALDALWRWR